AIDSGAVVLNDVSGLRHDPVLADVAARAGAGLILMHMRGTPRTMQSDLAYDDLVGQVRDGLRQSLEVALGRGCSPEQIVLDPGIGFGKSAAGNLELIAGVGRLLELGRPVLVGPSRKSFIGEILNVPVEERLEGTIAACLSALERGARLFRVHDVRQVRRAVDLAWAIRNSGT
ncbi:MAG: dihydropteroate synthase, partial [Gemmatimonadetes bacterium]|nr:dihydropteroate synthase [Gemmatimonadota bacterium]